MSEIPTPHLDELTRDECLTLLAGFSVGRIAVALPGAAPLVAPVNYALDVDGTIVFRSRRGTKLDALRGRPASFQIDHVDHFHRTGWSVLARGNAAEIPIHEEPDLPVEPWTGFDDGVWVRFVPALITGRRIAPADLALDVHGYL